MLRTDTNKSWSNKLYSYLAVSTVYRGFTVNHLTFTTKLQCSEDVSCYYCFVAHLFFLVCSHYMVSIGYTEVQIYS